MNIVMIKLFAPQQPGKRLSLHAARILRGIVWCKRVIELVRFLQTVREHTIEVFFREPLALWLVCKSQPNGPHLIGRKHKHILGRGLGSHVIRIHCLLLTLHDIIMKTILHVTSAFFVAGKAPCVGLIFCKEQCRLAFAE